MILIVNCIVNAEERAGFDKHIVPGLAEIAGRGTRILNLEQLAGLAPNAWPSFTVWFEVACRCSASATATR
jgi:hypothetical protein